ncbi:hypothetical protein [Streptomyces fradiae]|uniref:hypothetical protein n=1 Tax=Streptomyces fradiae TaxID=1906 RepID=UPI0033E0442E
MRRDRVDQAEVHAALAAYANSGSGVVDWAGVHAGKGHRTTTLPTYPFNRQRYWVSPPTPTPGTTTPNHPQDPQDPQDRQHPHHRNERHQHHG